MASALGMARKTDILCPIGRDELARSDCTVEVARAVKRQQGPVVLVGHGYRGTVITQAGDHSNVAALVYIAARARHRRVDD
jgi:predicted alpha/beta hydrolase